MKQNAAKQNKNNQTYWNAQMFLTALTAFKNACRGGGS